MCARSVYVVLCVCVSVCILSDIMFCDLHVQVATVNCARIIRPDEKGTNGVIHVIDKVSLSLSLSLSLSSNTYTHTHHTTPHTMHTSVCVCVCVCVCACVRACVRACVFVRGGGARARVCM